MAKLSDKEKKLIVADRANGESFRGLASKYGVSTTTIQRVLNGSKDDLAQLVTQKQEQDDKSVLEYMETQRETKKRVLKKILEAMEKKAENVDMFTNIRDLAMAYGVVMDKEFRAEELGLQKGGNKNEDIDGLSQSLMELAGELDADQ